MTHTERFVSMGITDEQFPAGTHMCYIYKDDQERKEFIAKYLSLGLQGHEKVNYFVDVISPEEMRVQLKELGLMEYESLVNTVLLDYPLPPVPI